MEEAREDAAAMEMSTEWESDGEPNWYSSSPLLLSSLEPNDINVYAP